MPVLSSSTTPNQSIGLRGFEAFQPRSSARHLLDTRYRHSSTVEITKGSINESLAYPRDIFRPVIGQSAYAFVLVHNHPSGEPAPAEADIRLTRRLAEGARILQINMLDHVIVGQSFEGRPGYFSFKEAGMI
jgi:DNA repair protein RadC